MPRSDWSVGMLCLSGIALLIDVWGPQPTTDGNIPRQAVLSCTRKPAKHEPELLRQYNNVSSWFYFKFLTSLNDGLYLEV